MRNLRHVTLTQDFIMQWIVLSLGILNITVLPLYGNSPSAKDVKMEEAATTPQYLYKVLSITDWQASQGLSSLKLASADDKFIHFSREDQLDRILTKYWADEAEFVILKIDAAKLAGNLVLEENPGGTSKYYHLYNGSIPLVAIADVQVVNQELH